MNNAVNNDTIVFGVSGTISINSQLPVITKDITINGAGQNVEIWGGNDYRIFQVNPGVIAEIDNLSIDNGDANGLGGGLDNFGDLTLKNDTFLNNQAIGGGAICNESDAILTMNAVSVNSNSAFQSGGGIANYGNILCEGHCSIVQNKAKNAGFNGGGLANYGGLVALEQGVQVTGNSADSAGGGIYQTAGTMNITGNAGTGTIEGNSASLVGAFSWRAAP